MSNGKRTNFDVVTESPEALAEYLYTWVKVYRGYPEWSERDEECRKIMIWLNQTDGESEPLRTGEKGGEG